MREAIADPEGFAIEPKIDGIRGLVAYGPDGRMDIRNRRGEPRGSIPLGIIWASQLSGGRLTGPEQGQAVAGGARIGCSSARAGTR